MKVGILVNYMVQYNYYVNVLCENKDVPELQCNGKCHLAEELKEAENPSAESPVLPSTVKVEPVFFFTETNQFEPLRVVTTNQTFFDFAHPTQRGFVACIDEPPEHLS